MKFHAFCIVIVLLSMNTAAAADCDEGSKKSMLSRVVAVDSTNGAIYGKIDIADNAPPALVLNDKEIVLTFDQGPQPANTEYILYTLDRFCAKAVFFFNGSAAIAHPEMVREVARRGHTIAAGPWSASASFANIAIEDAKFEIEKGLTAVAKAADGPVAPFFRIAASPAPDVLAYLRDRGVSLWSYDIASGDNEPGITSGQFFNSTLAKIREAGKGVIQFHDGRKVTVDTLDDILSVARQNGFKVVQPVPSTRFTPKEEYLAGFVQPAPKEPRPSRVSQSLVEAAKQRVRSRRHAEPQLRHPARSRPPEG